MKWCEFNYRDVYKQLKGVYGIPNKPHPKNTYVRCPLCNKRLYVQWRDCGDGDCWHPIISEHKVRKKLIRFRHRK